MGNRTSKTDQGPRGHGRPVDAKRQTEHDRLTATTAGGGDDVVPHIAEGTRGGVVSQERPWKRKQPMIVLSNDHD
ncbi:hypothetical protein ACI65C_001778 [Semiaphis heraclei]